MIRLVSSILFCLIVPAAFAEPMPCSMCHEKAPVKAPHPAVSDINPAACFTCHAAATDDLLFSSLHDKHPKLGMTCDSCHDTVDTNNLKARLKALGGSSSR